MKVKTGQLCDICGEEVSEVYILLDGKDSNGYKSGHKNCLKKEENKRTEDE